MPRGRPGLFVFVAVFATLAWIGPGASVANPNVITRLALTFALLEDASPRIDRFAPVTQDKAFHAGHFYADKAPGSSLLALPVAAALRAAMGGGSTPRVRDGAWDFPPRFIATARWASLLSAAAIAGAAAAMLGLARRLGASPGGALLAALVFGLGTPAAGWGTTYFGHALAAGLLLLGFAATLRAAGTDRAAHAALAGAVLSLGVLVEFTNLPPTLIVAGFGLWRLPRARTLAAALAGALAGLLPLLAYNTAAFGSPWHLGYADTVGFGAMRYGVFGISLPSPGVVVALLVGPARGLLWMAPVLALFPLAIAAAWRAWPRDVAAVLALVPLCALALNAGYAYWDGGFSTGPRHLTIALAFACLPLAALWDRAGRPARAGIAALALAGAAVCLASAAVDMTSPTLPPGRSPLLDHIWPELLAGHVHGVLPGPAGLLALPAIWLLASRALPRARPAG